MNYFHCVSFVGPKNEVVQNIPNETDCLNSLIYPLLQLFSNLGYMNSAESIEI